MKRLLLTVGFLLMAQTVFAQTFDRYTLTIYPLPSGTPTTFEMALSAVSCNQVPPATGVSTVNPTRAVWTDETNVGRVCQWTDPGTGPLMALPIGASYEATLRKGNAAGNGPESNRAPFSRALTPPTSAPAGVRLIRP